MSKLNSFDEKLIKRPPNKQCVRGGKFLCLLTLRLRTGEEEDRKESLDDHGGILTLMKYLYAVSWSVALTSYYSSSLLKTTLGHYHCILLT